jgi:cytidylate kinase
MLQSLIKDISLRDKSDKSRLLSPLLPAKDAHIIDTSLIDANDLMSIVTKIIEGKNIKI